LSLFHPPCPPSLTPRLWKNKVEKGGTGHSEAVALLMSDGDCVVSVLISVFDFTTF
jgi:hypothetical protein